LPEAIRKKAHFPTGARITISSNTSQLLLRTSVCVEGERVILDLYVEGSFWRSLVVTNAEESELICYADAPRQFRDVTIYLPMRQEIQITALGVDADADIGSPKPFASDLPLLLYGSSIAQGIGSSRPGMSYAAILSRCLNLDFVDLGFGGAGKAEPEVVDLVASIQSFLRQFNTEKVKSRLTP